MRNDYCDWCGSLVPGMVAARRQHEACLWVASPKRGIETGHYFNRCVAWSISRGRVCGDHCYDGRLGDVPLCEHHYRRALKDFERGYGRALDEFRHRIETTERKALMIAKELATSETTVTESPDGRFARAHNMWRSPVFHMPKATVTTTVRQWDGEIEDDTFTAWWCGGGSTGQVTYVDDMPEGCELCQRCVEGIDFEQRRDEQQASVDRTKYLQRTRQLLEEIQGR